MNWPKLPTDNMTLNTGLTHPAWNMFFTQLMNHLQTNFSSEGTNVPAQPSANITTIAAKSPTGLVLDSDTGDLKFINNGVVKTVTTS